MLRAVDPNHVSVVNSPHAVANLALFDIRVDDMYNERYVLRLQQDIERACDGRELAFVQNDQDSIMVVKVLIPAKLSEAVIATSKTFGDINGARLCSFQVAGPHIEDLWPIIP